MGGGEANFAGTYSYIEMYEGTPEDHPETGPDRDAARAVPAETTARVTAAKKARIPFSTRTENPLSRDVEARSLSFTRPIA